MQSLIILTLFAVVFIFGVTEYSRNGTTKNSLATFKAENVAGNVFIYHDLLKQYAIANYDKLGLSESGLPGQVGNISIVDYTRERIGNYSQMNFNPFINYQSVVFNYTRELESYPTAYMATSWNNFIYPRDKNTNMLEVLGQLGQDFSKRLYQGNSTYWIVPWFFSQINCEVREIFSQIPNDKDGNTRFNKVKAIFKSFCTEIESRSKYRFLSYVYMQPIYK